MMTHENNLIQVELESTWSEKNENSSLIFQTLEEEELKIGSKNDVFQKIFSEQSTKSDIYDFIKSKDTLESQKEISFQETTILSKSTPNGKRPHGKCLRKAESLYVESSNTKESNYNKDDSTMNSLAYLDNTLQNELEKTALTTDFTNMVMDDSVYERAEKFLDSTHKFGFVIPSEEHRPRKFVKVLTKHPSLKGDLLDSFASPLLSKVNTSSLLLRRENSPEFSAKSNRFQLTLSMQKCVSQTLDTEEEESK